MGVKRTARTARRAVSHAVQNTQRAARMNAAAAEVIARRISGPADAIECTRMVMEKMFAAQTAWWRVGAAMIAAAPRVSRAGAGKSGPFALWETAVAVSAEATAAMLEAQRAAMIPVAKAVRGNRARLRKT